METLPPSNVYALKLDQRHILQAADAMLILGCNCDTLYVEPSFTPNNAAG